ncbi:hypothetical protein IB276_05705 [Ensifer sp. ENS04]|uniref:hypothetical protein n=1 Tax=Ensifer sp. ENS04 TaxID=2769281 RepID=UPI001780BE22|nr:hypothetical protein [Ensifer sp. ENS04]MBD9538935.1 hypothetical protein [Ensifer sp. ENS04]
MSAAIISGALAAARAKVSFRAYSPTCTVKCEGLPIFRSQVARDLACLLDVNPSIVGWSCMPPAIEIDGVFHVVDVAARDENGVCWLFDAPDNILICHPKDIKEAAWGRGFRYHQLQSDEIYTGFRLRNAKDLLRYGAHEATLDDRLCLLTALEEHGALAVSDCLRAIRESKPTAALASMILQGVVEVELDDALIGPSTMVRRIRL